MNPDDAVPVDDDVLDAALALIDDVYEHAVNAKPKCVYRARREERQQLLGQVDELEHWLDAIRCIRAREHMTPLARAWAHVATRQQMQRDDAVRLNALLRAAVSDQRELAMQAVATLKHARHLLVSSIVTRTRFCYTLPLRMAPPPILAQHLDALYHHVLMNPLDTSPNALQDFTRWTLADDGAHFHGRLAGRYPFKLSTVARELWKITNEVSRDDTLGRLKDDEHTSSYLLRIQRPIGRMEVEGSIVTRRTFLPDGSVFLASASIATGPPTEDNLMAGLEMIDLTWSRVVCPDRGSAQSAVCVEMVNKVHVRANSGAQSGDAIAQLERFRAFGEGIAEEDAVRSKQVIENCLVSASMSTSSQSS